MFLGKKINKQIQAHNNPNPPVSDWAPPRVSATTLSAGLLAARPLIPTTTL